MADTFTLRGALEDVKNSYTTPIRWDAEDWFTFGGTLAAVATSHEFDQRVCNHLAGGPNGGLNGGQDSTLQLAKS